MSLIQVYRYWLLEVERLSILLLSFSVICLKKINIHFNNTEETKTQVKEFKKEKAGEFFPFFFAMETARWRWGCRGNPDAFLFFSHRFLLCQRLHLLQTKDLQNDFFEKREYGFSFSTRSACNCLLFTQNKMSETFWKYKVLTTCSVQSCRHKNLSLIRI